MACFYYKTFVKLLLTYLSLKKILSFDQFKKKFLLQFASSDMHGSVIEINYYLIANVIHVLNSHVYLLIFN